MNARLITAFAFLAVLGGGPTWAADPLVDAMPRTITVTGQGTVKAAPDEANFSTGVITQGATASQALAANSRAMNAVFATLKRVGIPDKDIQTSNLSLMPQYQSCKPGVACPQRIVGYQVSNNMNVTVEDFAKTGPVLDALVSSGSNQISGISFSIRNDKPLLKQARQEAVRDAVERAQAYAAGAGVSLGPILSIEEAGSEPVRPLYRAMAVMAEAPPPPVAGGEESVSASVTITWALR
jgi:uncharacterized protein